MAKYKADVTLHLTVEYEGDDHKGQSIIDSMLACRISNEICKKIDGSLTSFSETLTITKVD